MVYAGIPRMLINCQADSRTPCPKFEHLLLWASFAKISRMCRAQRCVPNSPTHSGDEIGIVLISGGGVKAPRCFVRRRKRFPLHGLRVRYFGDQEPGLSARISRSTLQIVANTVQQLDHLLSASIVRKRCERLSQVLISSAAPSPDGGS